MTRSPEPVRDDLLSDRREAYAFLKEQQNEKNEIFPGAWVMKVKDTPK